MDTLDAHLRDRILYIVLRRDQSRRALDAIFTATGELDKVSPEPPPLPSVMLVCREWRNAVADNVKRLVYLLLIRGHRIAFRKAFEKGCGVFMREMVRQSDDEGECWEGASGVLEGAILSSGATLDCDVVREFLRLGRCCWRTDNRLPLAIAAAVGLGRLDLAHMVAAHMAELDAADDDQDAHERHVREALNEAPSLAAFLTLRSVVFPDAPTDFEAVTLYAMWAIGRGVVEIAFHLLSEIDDPEFHGKCMTQGAHSNNVAAVVATMPLAPDYVIADLLVVAAEKGFDAVVRVIAESPRGLDAEARSDALDSATGPAVKALLDCDVDLGSTLVSSAAGGYVQSVRILLSRRMSRVSDRIAAARAAAIEHGHRFTLDMIDRMVRYRQRRRNNNRR